MDQFKVCLKENAAIREAEEKLQRAREAKEAKEREKQVGQNHRILLNGVNCTGIKIRTNEQYGFKHGRLV